MDPESGLCLLHVRLRLRCVPHVVKASEVSSNLLLPLWQVVWGSLQQARGWALASKSLLPQPHCTQVLPWPSSPLSDRKYLLHSFNKFSGVFCARVLSTQWGHSSELARLWIVNPPTLFFFEIVFFKKIYLFIYFWLHQVLVVARRPFVAVCRLLSSCGAQAPKRAGSVVVAHGLSCPVACGILVPRPGIEPVSPALQDGFLTTGPPGKSLEIALMIPSPFRISLSISFFLSMLRFWLGVC